MSLNNDNESQQMHNDGASDDNHSHQHIGIQTDPNTPTLSSTESYSDDDESTNSEMEIEYIIFPAHANPPIQLNLPQLNLPVHDRIDATAARIMNIVEEYVHTGNIELRVELMDLMIHFMRLMQMAANQQN